MYKLSIEVVNEQLEDMKVWMEPYCETFILEPDQKALIVSIFELERDHEKSYFSVGQSSKNFIVYTPGLADETYVEINGVRIEPSYE